MRDIRKIRDKVEIKLDNRQIAAIFIGSLVMLSIVFYLGVKVGSRLEQVRHVPTPRPDLTMGAFGATPTPWERAALDTPLPKPEPPTPTPEEPARTPKIISETPLNPDGDDPGGIVYTFEGTPAPDTTPQPTPTPAVAATPTPIDPQPGKYTVQVASSQNKEQADSEASKLKSHGWPAYVVKAEIPGKGVFYRVRIGQFEDMEGAEKMRDAIIKAEGREAFVAKID